MTVYVGPMSRSLVSKQWPYSQSCHMYADTEEELHVTAIRIGLKFSWFQSHSSMPHYDLTSRKRMLAVNDGAVSHTKEEEKEYLWKYLRESRGYEP